MLPPNSLTLGTEEIINATGYRQPCRQLRVLQSRGIRAERGRDGKVRVWRTDLAAQAAVSSEARPKVKAIK